MNVIVRIRRRIFALVFVALLSVRLMGEERPVVYLENERIRVGVFPGGGYIGEVRLLSSDPKVNLNPMRVPHYDTIDPQDYNDSIHNRLYGNGDDRKVMAGYQGHFLCFPYVGGLSEMEKEQGLGTHGEAVALEWTIERDKAREARGDGSILQMDVELPITEYQIKRSLQVVKDESVIYVDETVTSLSGFDRPFQWVQHTTFGPPFVELGKNKVDAPVIAPVWNQDAYLYQGAENRMWPEAEDLEGKRRDLRSMETKEGEGSYKAWLLDDSGRYTWFTMYHTDYKLLVGYLMPARWNPWIGDWQENKSKSHAPWNKEAVARGILIGTSPFTGGIRRSVDTGPFYGKDTVRWIGAEDSINQRYAIFMTEIPLGFRGVESLSVLKGFIHLKERETNKLISIKASELN